MPTASPGYLSHVLVLAYLAVSLGVFTALAARCAGRPAWRRAAALVLGLGAAAAGVAAIVELGAWWARGPADPSMMDPAMPAGGHARDYLAFWYVALSSVAFAVLYVRRQRGQPRSLARLVAGNALVLFALAAFAFVAGETYLRFVYDDTMNGMSLTQRAWMKRHVRVNRQGFRDADWPAQKAPGVVRVVFLGDSVTHGCGVERPEERLSGIVADELEARSPGGFEVWTAAVVGWTTGDELEWLRRSLPATGADRVVLGFSLNDAVDVLPPVDDRLWDVMARPRWVDPGQSFVFDTVWWMSASSRHAEMFARRYEREKQAFEDGAPWRQQLARMQAMHDVCRANGARLDVVLFPDLLAWGDEYAYDALHDRIAAAWRDLGAGVVDLRGAWRGVSATDLVAGRFDPHPNEDAHARAARAVLAALFDTP